MQGSNTDCILRHELLTNKYDIYYSNSYPSSLDRCQNITRRAADSHRKVTKSRHSLSSTSHNFKHTNSLRDPRRDPGSSSRWKSRKGSRLRACSSRWYLGVGGDHSLKVFITSENRTKREMFFIQKWHYSSNTSYSNRGIIADARREGVNVLIITATTTATITSQTPVRQDKADERKHSSRALQEDFGGLRFYSRPTPSSHVANNSSKSIPQFENTSTISFSSSSSSSSLSSFSTTSPLKRTRSSFLNSLRHKKDKRIDCSNLLKLNCTQQSSSDRDNKNLQESESS